MLRKPATRTAAATEAPAGTKIVRPSTITAMVAGSPSGRGRNIEAPCRKEVECRFERAGGDHRRKDIGMGAGEGDAASLDAQGARGRGHAKMSSSPKGDEGARADLGEVGVLFWLAIAMVDTPERGLAANRVAGRLRVVTIAINN